MSKIITIDPVTRIEGHAKVFVDYDDNDNFLNAGLVVNELRGFEKILTGIEADRLPLITARICGVCPTAHHLAASKALDNAAGVEAPPAAHLLRELMYMGHLIHSHALSLFVLQGPDLILGIDSPAAERNIVGVVKAVPEIAKKALRLRTLGQKINELIGGRGTHPVTSVAGGITFTLNNENKTILVNWIDELLVLVKELSGLAKSLLLNLLEKNHGAITQSKVPIWNMGTVKKGTLNFYDGNLKVIDENGLLKNEFGIADFNKHLVESVVDWSYMKEVRILSDEKLFDYRVGPLARINVIENTGTELADEELQAFKKLCGNPCSTTIMNIYARVIELIYAVENAKNIINNSEINGETRIPIKFKGGRGVAHVEAPRGTLIHDYEIDENGIVRSANLIVATQQNYTAINNSISQVAKSIALDKRKDESFLNGIEFAIRCYDPCLSCATHAIGQMPINVVVRKNGIIKYQFERSSNA